MAVDGITAEAGRFHEDLGIWVRTTPLIHSHLRSALFLDRDGVIVEDPGYLGSAADMVMIAGAAEIIRLANRLEVPVLEVTNQAGIARGYYGWKEFLEVEAALTRALAGAGAVIDGALACPYHRDGTAPWVHPAHPARKPRPGMLLAAAQFLDLDLSNSWIVGDKIGDLQAGCNAGLRGGLHVLTGHGPQHRKAALEFKVPGFDLRLGNSIQDAASIVHLISQHRSP
ncbi:MAG TPA: HAD-IIIA family hydrolase [Verrucomicrobiae bacterium]|nr:HAD-IIIA family hydrolase [Verrucomicrobiae bacterium]